MKSNIWQLDLPSEETKQDYLKRFLYSLRDKIINSRKLTNEIKEIIIPNFKNEPDLNNLEILLIGEPTDLLKKNDELMNKIMDIIMPLQHSTTKEEKNLKKTKKIIENVFNYSGFLSKNRTNSYWLSKMIQRNTCVYCNRQYIFTVKGETTAGHKTYITRPVFDHWFPKSEYPLLSMSLFNLIPSCTICNSSLKGRNIYLINEIFHPYIHGIEPPRIKFRISRTDGPNSDWTVKLDCENRKKETKTMKAFGLDEIYACHSNLEVKDIMKFNDAYPIGYLKQLFANVLKDSNGKMSRKDVYHFFFGTEMESDSFLDRPLSKMKYDILMELGLLDDE